MLIEKIFETTKDTNERISEVNISECTSNAGGQLHPGGRAL